MEVEALRSLASLMWILTGLIIMYIRFEHTKDKTIWWINLVLFIYYFFVAVKFTINNF